MEQELDFSSYNKIKRASNEELADLWSRYFVNHENKSLRDELILQYIYLTRYVVGRVKVALPPSFSYEDISSYGIEGLIDAGNFKHGAFLLFAGIFRRDWTSSKAQTAPGPQMPRRTASGRLYSDPAE